ncbi:MAG: hypothetical protein ABW360_12025 [Phenylobacterium sp.]
MTLPHSEAALQRIQRIVTVASRPRAPITTTEAYEQIVEELELAGFGSTELQDAGLGDFSPPARSKGSN